MHGYRMNAGKGEKASIKGALADTSGYMKKSVPAVLAALVLAAVGALLTIVGPDFVGRIATIMSDGLFTGIDLAAIAKIGIFLAAIYIISAVCTFTQHYIMATVTLKISYKMRADLSEKINRVPQKTFNTTSQGDILSRITNDVSTLQQGLTNSLPTIISASTQFVGCLIMMFVTEWRLALAALGVTFLGLLVLVLILSRSQKYFLRRQENLGTLNGYVEEMYSGQSVVRISRAEADVKKRFGGMNADVYDAEWRSQFLSGMMQPLMNVVGNTAYVVVAVLGSVLAMSGAIEFGVIVAFILYVRLFTSPLTQIAQGMTNMQTASASARRIFDFLGSEELPDESDKPAGVPAVHGAVSFDHVRFSYPDSPDKVIIKDFSAEVKPGQKVAIVGPTGAGKTTMVNLLMRFFELTGGSIRIDGVPTTELRRETLHSMFAMVLQDTWLFEGTVRENLVYNMTGITDDMLERVCRACGLDDFVHSLPQGFDTVLSESVSISAGQKQLLTIARAMLQNAPMLILDEATSSVDTRTEAVIQHAMDTLTADRTSFVIAHRLSTIKNADLILVMRDGDVVESGNHETLMQKGGFYADLYNSQFADKQSA
ncbi:MAG: ABC transporter [Oscillospiraceae bacterium]|nr:MAG: ABC transporter [Oscillospiraceae bacterium]